MARAAVRVVSNAEAVLAAVDRAQEKAILAASHELRNAWLRKLSGKRSGRKYRLPGTGPGRYYIASAPGEPPARRLGDLARSIKVEMERKGSAVEARVGSDLEYSKYLEFGTSGRGGVGAILPRPSLRPAIDENLERLKAIIADKGRWQAEIG